MTQRLSLTLVALAGLLVSAGSLTLAAVKEPSAVKCPVSGGPAKADKSVDFDGGKVYFCCGNCPKAFEADTAKFAAKAHQQMVATGELVQKGCPFNGKAVNPSTIISIGDAEVGFCCNNCKGKAEAASGDEQVALVFGDVSKGFEPKAK
jgi:YHS domain-containing protein